MSKFEVFEGHDGKYHFLIRAGNGEILARSEGSFPTREHARRGVGRLVALASSGLPVEDIRAP